MTFKQFAVVSAIALALAACSGSHSGNQQADSSQGAATNAPGNDASIPFPVYPGAQQAPKRSESSMKICGSSVQMTMFRVPGADGDTVGKWYLRHLPDALHVTIHPRQSPIGGSATNYLMFKPDGSSSVVVSQMHFTSTTLEKNAKRYGADHTLVGMSTYDPPLPKDVLDAFQEGFNGGGQQRADGQAKLRSKCGVAF